MESIPHESVHIITYNPPFRQPNFLEIPKESQNGTDSTKRIPNTLSEIQQNAYALYDIGLNVFPQPIAKKGGWAWKPLQYTRLDRNHPQYGLRMLFSGVCNMAVMCGRTSRNLFVIDCETEAALAYHIQMMQSRQIPLWVVRTRRGGHIYLFSADGEVENIASNILRDAEIKGSRGYVMAPPSIHPSQQAYKWLYQEGNEPPTVSIQQIDWLHDLKQEPIALVAHQPKTMKAISAVRRPYSPLSRRTRQYIHEGHNTPEGSRNNELFSAACDMVGNQFSQAEARQTLYPVAQASGLSTHEIDASLNSAYSQSRTPAKVNTAKNAPTADWQWALLYADNQTWTGRSGTSRKAIFTALIHRAKVSSNEDGLFRASVREIATLARKGTATVQRILKELEKGDKALIVKRGYDKTSQAGLWAFNQKMIKEAMQLNPDTLKESPQWLSCSVSVFALPDSVERAALGYNGLLVYRALCAMNKALFPNDLTKITGLAVHQVKYALKKLRQFEIVVRESAGWQAVIYDDATLDEKVAASAGVLGRGQGRAERFARERRIFAGRKMFNTRLRCERNQFKASVYETLRLAEIERRYFSDKIHIFKETVSKDSLKKVLRRRIPLADLEDDEDRELILLGLSLGAEVTIVTN